MTDLLPSTQVIDDSLLVDEVFAGDYIRETELIARDRREHNPLENYIVNSYSKKKIDWLETSWEQKKDMIYLKAATAFMSQGAVKPCTRAMESVRLYKRWVRLYGEAMTVFMFRRKLGIKLPIEVVETKEIKHALL